MGNPPGKAGGDGGKLQERARAWDPRRGAPRAACPQRREKMKQIAQSYAPKQGGLLVAPRHGVLESWGCQREPWDQGLLGQHEVTLCISHPQQE